MLTAEWRTRDGRDYLVLVQTAEGYQLQAAGPGRVMVAYEQAPDDVGGFISDLLSGETDLRELRPVAEDVPESRDPDDYGHLVLWRNRFGTGIEDRMLLAERLNVIAPVSG